MNFSIRISTVIESSFEKHFAVINQLPISKFPGSEIINYLTNCHVVNRYKLSNDFAMTDNVNVQLDVSLIVALYRLSRKVCLPRLESVFDRMKSIQPCWHDPVLAITVNHLT